MREEMGAENIFIFGMTVDEVAKLWANGLVYPLNIPPYLVVGGHVRW